MAYNVFCYKKGGYLETFANVKKHKEELKKHEIFVDGKHYRVPFKGSIYFYFKKAIFFIHLYMDSKCPRVRRLFDNAMMFWDFQVQIVKCNRTLGVLPAYLLFILYYALCINFVYL